MKRTWKLSAVVGTMALGLVLALLGGCGGGSGGELSTRSPAAGAEKKAAVARRAAPSPSSPAAGDRRRPAKQRKRKLPRAGHRRPQRGGGKRHPGQKQPGGAGTDRGAEKELSKLVEAVADKPRSVQEVRKVLREARAQRQEVQKTLEELPSR